jgi:hypothetical protein
VFENEGNNLFVPSIDPSKYRSQAIAVRRSQFQPGGAAEARFVISPSRLNSPAYNLTVAPVLEGLAKRNFIQLSVDNNRISRIEKGAGPFNPSVKQQVNNLRAVADCAFRRANDNEVVSLDGTGAASYEVGRGVPYTLEFGGGSVEYVKLVENETRAVAFPTLQATSPWRTVHRVREEAGFSGSSILFLPTLPSSKGFAMEAYDSSDSFLYRVNFSLSSSTCQVTDGTSQFATTTNLKQRINNIRPILDSLFDAVN